MYHMLQNGGFNTYTVPELYVTEITTLIQPDDVSEISYSNFYMRSYTDRLFVRVNHKN